MADMQGLLMNPLWNLGTGLLAAGGPQPFPTGIGTGLAQGTQLGHQGLRLSQAQQDLVLRQQLAKAQAEEQARTMQQAALERAQMEQAISSLPPELQPLARLNPKAATLSDYYGQQAGLTGAEGEFSGKGIDSQSAQIMIDHTMRQWRAANPNASPEEEQRARQQYVSAMAQRFLTEPQMTMVNDPVYGPRLVSVQPPPLPGMPGGAQAAPMPAPVQGAPMGQGMPMAPTGTPPMAPRAQPAPPPVGGSVTQPLPPQGEVTEQALPDLSMYAAGDFLNTQAMEALGFPPGTTGMMTFTGKPEVLNKPSEGQVKAGGWAERMAYVEKTEIAKTPNGKPIYAGMSVMEQDPEVLEKITSVWQHTKYNAATAPFVGGLIGPSVYAGLDPEFRSYLQLARAWVATILRKESGAAVTESEFQRYYSTYFAMPGETAAEIEQKRRQRLLEQREMERVGGRT